MCIRDRPTDACQFYYECSNRKALLRPNPGDCCVFCSFGSVKCPPLQQQLGCCS
nr:GDCCVxC domain-containing (seleno)protein [Pseudomonas sp. HS-2]